MSLKSRIDKAEAEAIARVTAEREAVITALRDWLDSQPPAEHDAFCRVFFERLFADLLARQAAGEKLTQGNLDTLAWHSRLGPLRPDDRAIAEALDARTPPELVARLKAASKSPLLADDGGA